MVNSKSEECGPGRPKVEISSGDMAKAEEYALEGCQNNTICTLMDWDHNLIEQRDDIKKKLTEKRAERKSKLYKAQFDNATLHKNHTMQIFLGVNELDQRDTKTHEVEPHTIADIAAIMGIGDATRRKKVDE